MLVNNFLGCGTNRTRRGSILAPSSALSFPCSVFYDDGAGAALMITKQAAGTRALMYSALMVLSLLSESSICAFIAAVAGC